MAGTIPVAKEEIPCCGNCTIKDQYGYCPIAGWQVIGNHCTTVQESFTSRCGCLSHPGARAYLNKDVIAELEMQLGCSKMLYDDGDVTCLEEAYKQLDSAVKQAIALLRGEEE